MPHFEDSFKKFPGTKVIDLKEAAAAYLDAMTKYRFACRVHNLALTKLDETTKVLEELGTEMERAGFQLKLSALQEDSM